MAKIKVTMVITEEFDLDSEVSVEEHSKGYYSRIDKLLEKGKRCIVVGQAYHNLNGNLPAQKIQVGDELFWIDGDSHDNHIGTVTSVEVAE